ncbi:MAG: class I tRNA ligase family protein [Paludibacteraceae bacterium]|nr:class I tRNA ligase family protein [Paludibacteraceae bacterium]
MDYNFSDIERKWQAEWAKAGTYKVSNQSDKKPFYVLDMFPYPSGAGLHVGHPLGYIASDIYSRYKRLQGFNVLHPMGFDSYGLPAEQYAIQTGQHPEKTTMENIAHYIEQLQKIGFNYDWDREVKTCNPDFYKWTQWAFIQMFNSYFDTSLQKAQPISKLIEKFEQTDPTWATLSEKEQQERLMNYRIAYLADTKVNWCPQLGCVLANDEVSEGLSVRGGYPVEQRVMRQWNLRVSAYAPRLLQGLDTVDWTDSLKETQRNWIGRSEGAEMRFAIKGQDEPFTIFTTRADTVYGVTFMVLAPESEYVARVTTEEQKAEVEAYLQMVKNRTERERIADRRVTGVFAGSYAINPLTKAEIPIYVSDYVLSGYGTGAIMAVPAHDSRDYAFAKHFNLPIIPLIEGADVSEQSFDAKEGVMINSGFLNGMQVKDAIQAMKEHITNTGLGRVKVNYRLRDAVFSRQRYWGEPFPVYYKDGMPYMLPEECLPLLLPEVSDFKPTTTGEPPLGNADLWAWDEKNNQVVSKSLIDNISVFPLELCTMPGFAGSSAYYLRYMDNHNDAALVGKEANDYWRQVNLYIGGTEHATGHLIYSRFWNKFLYDLGYICEDEPFRKLINQGMIQGRSNFVYRYIGEGATGNLFISYNLIDNPEYKDKVQPIHVNVNIVKNDVLDIDAFRNWMPEFKNAEFVYSDGTTDVDNPYMGTPTDKQYICGWAVEKMSKSMFNVVNPDDVVAKYGADTLRLYEMFLGPLEMSKPWDTNGIDGVHRFLRKWWNMFETLSNDEPTAEELRSLHKLIKKITWDIENFSFNTSIPAFMIAQNELQALKCNKVEVLKTFAILLAPYAPHIAEEAYQLCQNTFPLEGGARGSVCDALWPACNEAYLVESTQKYPVQFNGKVRFTIEVAKDTPREEVEKIVMAHELTAKQLNGAAPKKVIVVPGKIVNIVM